MTPPDILRFTMDGPPPRHTLQASRGAVRTAKGIRFFTKAPAREEAAWMRGEFARRLPAGWVPRPDPCRVTVRLVYPLRRKDRVQADDALLPHATRPDADGLLKSLLDCLTGFAWVDDGQVYNLSVSKWRGLRPRWEVVVEFDAPKPPPPPRPRRGATRQDAPRQTLLDFPP